MKHFFSALFLFSITSLTFAQNSILFDASDQQYLTISNADNRFNATADFTYEVWVKFTSKRFNGQRLAPFFGGQQHDYAALIDDRIGMRLNSNGVCSGDRTFGNASTIDTDIWYHIAYVRSGSVVSLYLDGTLLGTTECAQEDGSVKGVWMINANTINIGAIFWNTSYLDGYIGGMRYVVGTALYSEDFTPQLRWEKTNETILLMNIKNEDAAFTDESDYSNTINLNGSSSTPTFVAGNGPTLPADILLSGDVSAENNQIKNIADPTHTQDAATKGYVDSNVNSFSGSYNDLTDTPTIGDGILASVTENGNTGVRLSTSNADNHGEIGDAAVDLSKQGASSATRGATGYGSFASGYNTTASESYSTSLGSYTVASGYGSTAIGRYTTASGYYSVTMGHSTTASDWGSLVIGRYNSSSSSATSADSFSTSNPAFVIGNGTANSARSDAFKVMFNGDVTTSGSMTVGAITIPNTDGTSGQVLTTDGSGTLSWSNQSSGTTTYSVGDIAQGGKVFWVDETGQHGLVVALEDAAGSTAIDWSAGTNISTLATGTGIYAGKMNTMIIIAAHAAVANNGANFAAKACNEYTYTQNGVTYGDWYLPSKDELHLIKTSGVGAPSLYSYNYWSSTEYDSDNAYAEVLGNYANNYNENKEKDTAEQIKVRAIRSF